MNWDADFAGLPPVTLPYGRRLETLSAYMGKADLAFVRIEVCK